MSVNLSAIIDKLALKFLSKGREIDGLWIGSLTDDDQGRARGRVEAAFALIKSTDPIQYRRTTRHLRRIWINVIPNGLAQYQSSIDACLIDERYVLSEETSIEMIASSVVHETTHARLDHLGIQYEEKKRSSIERICLGREVAFLKRLPGCEKLLQETVYARNYYAEMPEYFTNQKFNERAIDGIASAMRYLNAPSWFIKCTSRLSRRRRKRV